MLAVFYILFSRQAREDGLKKLHNEYLEDHPEVKEILADFISAALVEQPTDVFEFAQNHFKGTATAVEEEEDGAGSAGEGGDDLDDLDGLDDMGDESSSELRAHLQDVFNEMDKDGSGTITRNELAEKLKADDELQKLLTAAGGDGNWYVLEQLDLDGDGEITWMEFEAMLATDGKMK